MRQTHVPSPCHSIAPSSQSPDTRGPDSIKRKIKMAGTPRPDVAYVAAYVDAMIMMISIHVETIDRIRDKL